MEEDF